MKKLFLIIATVLFLCACGKDNDDSAKTYCWVFTAETVISVQGASLPGYPQTTTVNTEQCGLTEEEADMVVKSLNNTSTSTVEGVKVTIKTTATKKRK